MCDKEDNSNYVNNTSYSENSEVSNEIKLERVRKAVEAFSQLPPEWWDSLEQSES